MVLLKDIYSLSSRFLSPLHPFVLGAGGCGFVSFVFLLSLAISMCWESWFSGLYLHQDLWWNRSRPREWLTMRT